jgi:hypothetical protein
MYKSFKRLTQLIGLVVVGLLVFSGGVAMAGGSAAPAPPAAVTLPMYLNFQGVLRNAQGQPIANGNYNLTVRIYNSMTAPFGDPCPSATCLWKEALTGVVVRDGRFSVTLGSTSAMPATLFTASGERFVGVTVEGHQEMLPRQRLASVPYAVQADAANTADLAARATVADNGVPVGAIIDWYRPNDHFPIPAGYKIADGTLVNDPASPLHGLPVPNLADRFVRGVTNAALIGLSGGADTHFHSVDDPAHSHSIQHNHPSFSATTDRPSSANGTGLADSDWYAQGDHTHSVTIDVPDFQGSSGTVDQPPVNSSSASSLPPYYGLLKLVRIK